MSKYNFWEFQYDVDVVRVTYSLSDTPHSYINILTSKEDFDRFYQKHESSFDEFIDAQIKKNNMTQKQETEEYTGGSSSYYQLNIEYPVTEGQAPFTVECIDVARVLNMDAETFNIFKACWRIAAAAQGKKKKGNNAIYDFEKIVFFGQSKLDYLKRIEEGNK